jgi:hypothetical protein
LFVAAGTEYFTLSARGHQVAAGALEITPQSPL